MNIAEEQKADVAILHITGRLDATTSTELDSKVDALIAEKKYKLLFDLKGMDYLSSAGMRVLLSTTKKLKAVNGKFVVASLSHEVFEIIKMAGFHQILTIVADEPTGLSALA